MSSMRKLLGPMMLVAVLGVGAPASAQRIVTGGEPGPGQLNGPKDCVRVEVATSNTGKAKCPKSKYMLVCGAPSASADRKRSCL